MKQKKSHHLDTDTADNTLQDSAKIMNSDVNTVASSIDSYDTTEDLTDSDSSLQKKSDSRQRKSSSVNNRNESSKKSGSGSIKDGKPVGKVQFSTKPNILFMVESHEGFSAKERGGYWWSEREKDRMMAKHERLVAKYEQQKATKPGSSRKLSAAKIGSYRGLESWTAAGSLKLDYSIEQCISSVMDEQDRQWNENDDDASVIAKKSLAVTEDSARRARLNGLQDAQEALRVRGESWTLKGGSDDISVSSAISTGTTAIAKKKKRSKLLARLDDSHKMMKNSDHSDKRDALASFKKTSSKKDKKDKKKKKKSSKKSHRNETEEENISRSSGKSKKKKKKDKTGMNRKSSFSLPKVDDVDIEDPDQPNSRTTITTLPTSIGSRTFDQEKPAYDTTGGAVDAVASSATTETPANSSFMAGPTTPVSPLSTHDEYPLLATLRRQQEQLRQSSIGNEDGIKPSVYQHRKNTVTEDEDDCNEDSSPLLQTLRRQQKKQSMTWQNAPDPCDDGNSGAPSYSGGPVNKVSSFRLDNTMGEDSEPADTSDPPGRRPRRLASRHVAGHQAIPENSTFDEKAHRSRSRSNDKYKKTGRSDTSLLTTPVSPSGTRFTSPLSPQGKKTLKILRRRGSAKAFFKKGAKK